MKTFGDFTPKETTAFAYYLTAQTGLEFEDEKGAEADIVSTTIGGKVINVVVVQCTNPNAEYDFSGDGDFICVTESQESTIKTWYEFVLLEGEDLNDDTRFETIEALADHLRWMMGAMSEAEKCVDWLKTVKGLDSFEDDGSVYVRIWTIDEDFTELQLSSSEVSHRAELWDEEFAGK